MMIEGDPFTYPHSGPSFRPPYPCICNHQYLSVCLINVFTLSRTCCLSLFKSGMTQSLSCGRVSLSIKSLNFFSTTFDCEEVHITLPFLGAWNCRLAADVVAVVEVGDTARIFLGVEAGDVANFLLGVTGGDGGVDFIILTWYYGH